VNAGYLLCVSNWNEISSQDTETVLNKFRSVGHMYTGKLEFRKRKNAYHLCGGNGIVSHLDGQLKVQHVM
jgi:hypothetical protein